MTNKHVKISDSLHLVEQKIPSKKKVKKVVAKRVPQNNIYITDLSYSMYYETKTVADQLIEICKRLPVGDTVTLGYFASEGQYSFYLKGFKISAQSDYSVLEKAIRNNSDCLGCTCFSEIIDETETVIKDLSTMYGDLFSFSLFTDGCPVVSNYRKEIDGIFSAIEKIKGKVTTSIFIGYGHYYNKELMGKMAEKMGGMLIHNSDIKDFTPAINKLSKLGETVEPKVAVDPATSDAEIIFTVTDQGVVLGSLDEGKVYVSPQKGKDSYVYYITDRPIGKSVDIDSLDMDSDDSLVKALYGMAYVLCQKMDTDKAMEVMGAVGDVQMVDLLTNAFTTEEYGNVESVIDGAINDSDDRFEFGRDTGYLPKEDAFSGLDVAETLMADDSAVMYPYDKRFTYEKIGKSNDIAKGYSKFTPADNVGAPLNGLVWNKTKLNLSVRLLIGGTINLRARDGVKPADLGLKTRNYPVSVWRNYTLIKDGRINLKKMYVSTSDDTYETFSQENLVFDDTRSKDGIYGIDLSGIPSINRATAKTNITGTELCKNVYRELELQAELKVLKFVLNDEFPEEHGDSMLEQARKLLEENGVKDGIYSPKMDSTKMEDFYMAKRFAISVDKIASLPSYNAVKKKIDAGKKLTPREAMLEHSMNTCSNYNGHDKKGMIEARMADAKHELAQVRGVIQRSKISSIVGKSTYPEFESRDQNTLEVDGRLFKFVWDEEKVAI